MRIFHVIAVFLLLAGSFAVPHAARAAESYDNCTGYIDTVPTTISTQGVWCMNKDMATSLASGNAITIATNNVTLDCNDFKLGGLAAGTASQAMGIAALLRQNITIRHCNIRGFLYGIELNGGAGHLVEDNLIDGNLLFGIDVDADSNCVVRRNRVFDTGGSTHPLTTGAAWGIRATGDIIDNIVDGVFSAGTTSFLKGIEVQRGNVLVSGNRVSVRNPQHADDGGYAYGITDSFSYVTIAGNHVTSYKSGESMGYGIVGRSATESFCKNNTVAGFANAIVDCADVARNYPAPTNL